MANVGRDGRVAMVLSGGVALGAYQAGAYAALHQEGLRPDWLAGSSIGAVNAAIIAGNPPERRIERLREFWDGAAIEPVAPGSPLWADPPSEGPWRHAYNWMSTLQSRIIGRPGLFRPRLLPGGAGEAYPSLYDLAPMRARLEALVDFHR